MRCIACNKNLSDYEATKRNGNTKEYLDLCNKCISFLEPSTVIIDRPDLRDTTNQDDDEDSIEVTDIDSTYETTEE